MPKKGISSVQLATDISLTQKTAWYILHKVRTLFKQDDDYNNNGYDDDRGGFYDDVFQDEIWAKQERDGI